MLRRFRRSLQVSGRRVRSARQRWIQNSLDAALPPTVDRRIPAWAQTPRGRVALAALALVVLLGWLLLLALLTL